MTARIFVFLLALVGVAACANALAEDALYLSADEVTLAAGRTEPVMAIGGGGGALVWTSDHPDIATVMPGADGEATIVAVAIGKATVSASMGQVASSLAVTVTAAELDRIDVTSTRTMLPRGLTLQLVATGTYSDRHTEDLSAAATWASSDPSLATIDPMGLVTGKAAGAAMLSATAGAKTGSYALGIVDAQLTSIKVAAIDPTLPKGLAVQLAVTGVFTDGSTSNVSDLVTWTSTNAAALTVSHGLVTAVAATGTATITATAEALSDAVTIAAAPAVLRTIAVGPSPLALAVGLTQPLRATGTYSDTTTSDVTAQATWSVPRGTAITVTTVGVAHAAAQGTATVKAAIGALAGTLDISVGPASIDHLALSSGDLALRKQQRAQLHAKLVYTDATTTDVTASATWSTAGTTVAIAAGKLDAGVTPGPTTITAAFGGKQASVVATVGTATCHPVIGEVQAGGSSASDEWVELYDPCNTAFDLTTWTLVYRAAGTIGVSDNSTLVALAGTLAPGELRLYAGAGYTGTAVPDATWNGASGFLQGASGAVGLRSGPKDTGALVDAVAYGTLTAGHPFSEGGAAAPTLANGKSVARLPFDGNDTDHNATDFVLVGAPTPRALNAP